MERGIAGESMKIRAPSFCQGRFSCTRTWKFSRKGCKSFSNEQGKWLKGSSFLGILLKWWRTTTSDWFSFSFSYETFSTSRATSLNKEGVGHWAALRIRQNFLRYQKRSEVGTSLLICPCSGTSLEKLLVPTVTWTCGGFSIGLSFRDKEQSLEKSCRPSWVEGHYTTNVVLEWPEEELDGHLFSLGTEEE